MMGYVRVPQSYATLQHCTNKKSRKKSKKVTRREEVEGSSDQWVAVLALMTDSKETKGKPPGLRALINK
jgi:hypothetical protein